MKPPLIEIASASNRFIGRCPVLAQAGVRLLDLLNRQSQLISLIECEVWPLTPRNEPSSVAKACFIPRERIIWARPVESRKPATRKRPGAVSEYYIAKHSYPVSAIASPYTIGGRAHILPGADPTTGLASLISGFLPITDAIVTMEGRAGLSWTAEVILLHGSMAEFFCVEPVAARAIDRQAA